MSDRDASRSSPPPAQSLAQLRRQLMQLAPRKRRDALLEPRDARRLVRSMPAGDLYTTVHDLGLADATELVQLASPAQFRSFVDLGAWKGDEVDEHALLLWLRAARDEEGDTFLEKLEGLDLELLEILLLRMVVVHDLEEDPDVNPDGVTMETPEGQYLIEFKVDGVELSALRQVLDALIAKDPFQAVRLLEAVRWEVPTELEETAFRFRSARLSEFGFPPLDEAMSLYAYRDPAPFAPAGGARSEGLTTAALPDLLGAALRGLEADELETLEGELRLLSNQALVAEGAEPGDVEAQRETLERVRDILQLGLEYATGGDASAASDAVRTHHLRDLFQVGFSLALELKFRADRLMKRPMAKLGNLVLLMPWEQRVVEGLRQRRPRRVLRVEGAEPVAFRSRKELAECAQVLDRAEAQVSILGALLGGDPAAAKSLLEVTPASSLPLTAGTIFAAALAHALLEGQPSVAPLSRAEVERVLGLALGKDGIVLTEAGVRAREVLLPLVEPSAKGELERLIDATLQHWSDELGAPIAAGAPLEPVMEALFPVVALQ